MYATHLRDSARVLTLKSMASWADSHPKEPAHATRKQTGLAHAHRRATESAPGDCSIGYPALYTCRRHVCGTYLDRLVGIPVIRQLVFSTASIFGLQDPSAICPGRSRSGLCTGPSRSAAPRPGSSPARARPLTTARSRARARAGRCLRSALAGGRADSRAVRRPRRAAGSALWGRVNRLLGTLVPSDGC